MRTKVLSLLSLFVFGAMTVFAQSKTDKFKVSGSCDLCKTRIEKAAMSVPGVTKATWDMKSEMMDVTFDSQKTSDDNIQKAIAAVGHDTPKYRASDAVYDKLPACCHYDRTPMETKAMAPMKKHM
ncbi:MAG TPA: cation transporter [Williamwhitmania sp.]|nr:cation transporter [Williamwhitmania sp.]